MYAFWAIVLAVFGIVLMALPIEATAIGVIMLGASFGMGVMAVLHYADIQEEEEDDW